MRGRKLITPPLTSVRYKWRVNFLLLDFCGWLECPDGHRFGSLYRLIIEIVRVEIDLLCPIFDLSEVVKHCDFIVVQIFDVSEVGFAGLTSCATNV